MPFILIGTSVTTKRIYKTKKYKEEPQPRQIERIKFKWDDEAGEILTYDVENTDTKEKFMVTYSSCQLVKRESK